MSGKSGSGEETPEEVEDMTAIELTREDFVKMYFGEDDVSDRRIDELRLGFMVGVSAMIQLTAQATEIMGDDEVAEFFDETVVAVNRYPYQIDINFADVEIVGAASE